MIEDQGTPIQILEYSLPNEWRDQTEFRRLASQDEDDKAEALFCRSLPEQYIQYKQVGYVEIPSKLFPNYKYVVDFSILLYKIKVPVQYQHGIYSHDLGKVCVTLDKSVGYLPVWDRRLQLCLMLLYQEKTILQIGNWVDNRWAMSGGYTAYEYLKANGNLYVEKAMNLRPWYRRLF